MPLYDVLKMEQQLTKVLFKMERNGIHIDPSYCQRAAKWESDNMLKVARDFKEQTGWDYKDSNKLFAEVFTQLGLRYPKTEKGVLTILSFLNRKAIAPEQSRQ